MVLKRRRKKASRGFDFGWVLTPFKAAGRAASGVWSALRTDPWAQLLMGVMVFAAFSRFVQPDWYQTRQFHPDERWLFSKTAELSYPAEPGKASGDSAGLQYGSLPLYLVATAKDLARLTVQVGAKVHLFKDPNFNAYEFVIVAGRMFSGLVDMLSVLGLFFLGRKLWGSRAGLMAAALLALAPLHIQLSHFFTVDPLLALFCIATLYACAGVMRGGGWGWSLASGAFLGAALASKTAAIPLLAPIFLAHAFRYFDAAPSTGLRTSASRQSRHSNQALVDLGTGLGISLGAAAMAFFICMPWAILDMSKFLRNQAEQQNILVKGAPDGVPFVRQYWDTLPVLFHLRNVLFYYQWLIPGALCLGAFAWYLVQPLRQLAGLAAAAPELPRRAARSPRKGPVLAGLDREALLLLSWMVPYLLVVGFAFAKFARYMLPFIPFLCLLGARALEQVWDRFPARRRWTGLAAGLVFASALACGLGYVATYFRPHPWVEASQWIFKNVPLTQTVPAQGKTPAVVRRTSILNETWGDDLPVDIQGKNSGLYHDWQMGIVEWDSQGKLQQFGVKLAGSDILVLADARAYGTYLRIPTRFPLTHAYYDLLFHDPRRLGFELAFEASNRPGFLGFRVNDSRTPSRAAALWADESFTLYDHPHAFLFRKVTALTPEEITQVLTTRVKELGLPDGWTRNASPNDNLRQARGAAPAQLEASQNKALVNPNLGLSRGRMIPLGAAFPVATWWVLMLILGLLAAPLASLVFSSFSDRGYALSKSLGLLLFSWLGFWLCSLKVIYFYQSSLWLVLGSACVVAGAVAWRRKEQVRGWWQSHRLEILWSEGIFAAAFLFYCLVRAYNPNIHDIATPGYGGGGEPLGMTYLSALTRCATFPAYDPWLALSSSSYYYFGYEIAATLTKLSGLPTAVTYNLSLSLFFALTVLGAYGVGLGLTSRRRSGLACALAVACLGSLWTFPYLVNQASATAGHGFFSVFKFLGQLFAQSMSWGFIWDPTRFPQLVNGYIFEFPYFSYLYSDLHPHNMVVPFSLLLLGLLLVPFKSGLKGLKAFGKDPAALGAFIFLYALAVDVQYCINTWNWPVVLALGLVSLPLAGWAGRPSSRREKVVASLQGMGMWALTALLGIALMWAFRKGFSRGVTQIGRIQANERQMGSYIPLAFFTFGLAGLFSLASLRFKAWGWGHEKVLGLKKLWRLRWAKRAPKLAIRFQNKFPGRFALACLWLGAILVMVALNAFPATQKGVLWTSSVLALFSLGGLSLLTDSSKGSGEEAYVWVLAFTAMAMVAGSEIYFVADRTNTIFKFWFQAWVMMGLVFAYGIHRVLEAAEAVPKVRVSRRKAGRNWTGPLVSVAYFAGLVLAARLDLAYNTRYSLSLFWLVLGLAALLVGGLVQSPSARPVGKALLGTLLAAGLVYPLGATLGRTRICSGWKNPHLDGLAFMSAQSARSSAPDNFDYDRFDAGAIRWLSANADKTETLLEAPGRDMYKGFTRYSIYTGLPTLLGWKYQVSQQLGQNAGNRLDERERDCNTLYATVDLEAARALLTRYQVRWVAVGGVEKKLYPAEGLAKFSQLCTVAYQNDGAILYRYDQPK